jgi:hypothetical protein
MNDLLGVRNFTGSAAGVKLPRSKRIDGRSHGNRVVEPHGLARGAES